MRIVQFIQSLGNGGAEAIVRDYAIELARRGHDVEVITLFPLINVPNEQILRDNQICLRSIYDEIYLFQSTNILVRALRKPLKIKKVSNWLRKYIVSNKPDVIHMHLSVQQFFVPCSDILKGIRLVYTCHNEVNVYFGDNHRRETKDAKLLIENNDMQMVALHNRMAEELNQLFGISNTVVLNNPVDVERFIKARERRKEMRNVLGIPENKFVVGHVGRFTYQKNHEMLVKIFAEVAKKNADAFLLMIGNGELLEDVKQQLTDMGLDEKYMILSDRKDVPELMSAMDVFVFPSRYEGFGIAFLEAQVVGTRCIGSDVMPDSILIAPSTRILKLSASVTEWADVTMQHTMTGSVGEEAANEFDLVTVADKLVNTVYRK